MKGKKKKKKQHRKQQKSISEILDTKIVFYLFTY